MSDAGFEDVLSQRPFCVVSAVAFVDIVAFANSIVIQTHHASCRF